MAAFLVAAATMVVLGLALLFKPFWRARGSSALSRQQLNAAIYRDQFARLDQDRADALLADADYEQARAELQRRVLDDVSIEQDAAPLTTPRKTLWALGLALPLAAGALYLLLGTPATLDPNGPQRRATAQDINRMVEGLARKLEQEPDNLQGWLMLGRSYKMLGRSQEAEKAFERATPLIEKDAQLLAIYADLLASNANGSFQGKPRQLIEQALKLDPENAMALWLYGSALFSEDQFDKAIQVWQKLVPLLEPGSEDAKTLQDSIDAAHARLTKKAQPAGRSRTQSP